MPKTTGEELAEAELEAKLGRLENELLKYQDGQFFERYREMEAKLERVRRLLEGNREIILGEDYFITTVQNWYAALEGSDDASI